MEMLQGVWKQHLRPRAVVGYGVKIFLPSPPNYVTRSPGREEWIVMTIQKIFWEFLSGYSMEFKLENNVYHCVPTDFKDLEMWSIHFGDFAYVTQASNLKC